MKQMLVLLSIAATALTVPNSAAAESEPVQFQAELMEGETFDLTEWRGSWVVVNYWATWCAPCRKEMPELEELHSGHDRIRVIGLAMDDSEAAVIRQTADERGVTYPLAHFTLDDEPPVFGPPRVLPTTILIDPQGVQVREFLGPVTGQEILAAIDGYGE